MRSVRSISRSQTPQCRLHCRHQQRSGHSFARDIGDCQTKLAAVVEVDEVVIVTTDATRGFAETCHLHRYAFRRTRRKQTLLHFRSESEFATHSLLGHHAFGQSRVVDYQRELRGDRHQQLAIGNRVLKTTASWSKRKYSDELVLLSYLDQQGRLDRTQYFVFIRALFPS